MIPFTLPPASHTPYTPSYSVLYLSRGRRGLFGDSGPSQEMLAQRGTCSFCKHLPAFASRSDAQNAADALNKDSEGADRCFWVLKEVPEFHVGPYSQQMSRAGFSRSDVAKRALYKVQVWEGEVGQWEDDDTCPPASQADAHDDAHEIRRRCAHQVHTRVVPA